MQKKLIFLRNGEKDFNQVWCVVGNDYEVNPLLNIGVDLYDIDNCIGWQGYKQAVEYIQGQLNVWYVSSYPSILYNNMWWNEEEHKWEIYFIEKGKLKNISEFTDKELRVAHNIERVYLNGGLDD